MATLKRAWLWLLNRTSGQIMAFHMLFWMPFFIVTFCWLVKHLELSYDQFIYLIFPYVYGFFLPMLFDCSKDWLKSKM